MLVINRDSGHTEVSMNKIKLAWMGLWNIFNLHDAVPSALRWRSTALMRCSMELMELSNISPWCPRGWRWRDESLNESGSGLCANASFPSPVPSLLLMPTDLKWASAKRKRNDPARQQPSRSNWQSCMVGKGFRSLMLYCWGRCRCHTREGQLLKGKKASCFKMRWKLVPGNTPSIVRGGDILFMTFDEFLIATAQYEFFLLNHLPIRSSELYR